MQKQDRSKLKSISVDILGVLLIIAAALTGWLPGPGGIPLLILGLSLLATNHEWAERWVRKLKASGGVISEKFFNGSQKTKWAIDVITIALITGAVLLITQLTASVAKSAGISLLLLSVVLLFANRSRFQTLRQRFFKK